MPPLRVPFAVLPPPPSRHPPRLFPSPRFSHLSTHSHIAVSLQSRLFCLYYLAWVSLFLVSQFSESRFLKVLGLFGLSFCVLCHVLRNLSYQSHKPMRLRIVRASLGPLFAPARVFAYAHRTCCGWRQVIGITIVFMDLGILAVIALVFTDLSNFKGLQVFNNMFLGRLGVCQVMELAGVYGVILNMAFGIVFASFSLKRGGYHRFLFLVCLLLQGAPHRSGWRTGAEQRAGGGKVGPGWCGVLRMVARLIARSRQRSPGPAFLTHLTFVVSFHRALVLDAVGHRLVRAHVSTLWSGERPAPRFLAGECCKA